MATVKMVTTGDLFAKKDGENYKFILPAYQRGYRWRSPKNDDVANTESSQILQLLVDIEEYLKTTVFNEKFYCMQPVVVAEKSNNEYYLVDGQQRLTTFFLLYKFLKYDEICSPKYRRLLPQDEIDKANDELNRSVFTLKYDNRRVEDLLNDIQNVNEIDDTTADKYFLSSAYLCIKKWFDDHNDKELPGKFRTLLERTSSQINVPVGEEIPRSLQFIWYELEDDECNEQEKLFQRINKGKLPLTSAELIKAFLFGEFDRKIKNLNVELCKNEDSEYRKRITQSIKNAEQAKDRFEKEWEEYENAMQDEAFWYFISKHNYDTRLEYLFELILLDRSATLAKGKDKLCCGQNIDTPQHTFALFKKMYDESYKGNGGIEAARRDFFEYYQKLKKYYSNWDLYHLIGCLIHLNIPMDEIFRYANEKRLISEVASELRGKILRTIFPNKKDNSKSFVTNKKSLREALAGLQYDIRKEDMRSVLFVFNIASILRMKQKNTFFSFDQYHKGKWDLEHICSQNQNIDANKQDQWLDTILDYFLGTAFVPPPPGYENKKEAKIRIKDSQDIFQKNKEKYLTPQLVTDFYNLVENPVKITLDDLKRYILCGIYLVKDGTAKKNIWQPIFQLVNQYELNNEKSPNPTHTLHNITLLDEQTNRTYKDAPFFVKRKHIISVEENGRFILPGTRNIFVKNYSEALDNMLFWDPEKDGNAYFNKIHNTLTEFFALPDDENDKQG